MLVSFGLFGYAVHAPIAVKLLCALALPTTAAVLWGLFFSPKASIMLAQPWNAMGEYALFALAGWALYAIGNTNAAVMFVAIAFISETISLLPVSK